MQGAYEDLISVVVPAYNVERYIERCLESIRGQTYEKLEIIVVDDGSSDNTLERINKEAEIDERIVVISQPNQGATSARNNALAHAHGKYVGFVDGDDWIEPDMYEALYEECICNNAEICVGKYYQDRDGDSHKDSKRSFVEGIITKESGEMPHNIIYSDDYSQRGISPNLWDKLFLFDLVCKHQKNVDEKTVFAEDDLCVYGSLLDASRVVVINKYVYHYCIREDSITQRTDIQYFEKVTFFYEQMKKVFGAHKSSELLMAKLDRYMAELIIRGLNRSFDYGRIVAFFQPPFQELVKHDVRNIIIYGAGDVGQDYYHELRRCGYHVVAWCDKRWEDLKKRGMNVDSPERIISCEYDVIVVAVESDELLGIISDYLIDKLNVEEARIIAERPVKVINNVF